MGSGERAPGKRQERSATYVHASWGLPAATGRAWYVAMAWSPGGSAMLRSCSRVTAMVAGLSMTAQAAEPETLTLACQGTRTITTKPEPISMGIIVNFTKNTVQGFGSPSLMDVKIASMNDVTVTFGGAQDNGSSIASIRGNIDRVTGDVDATSMTSDAKTGKNEIVRGALLRRGVTRRVTA
jgi:hypothetical protein